MGTTETKTPTGPPPGRRTRLEANLYERRTKSGERRIELGYRDSTGRQRWKTLPADWGIRQCRAERDTLLGRRGQGEFVKPSPKLKFSDVATNWLDQLDVKPNTYAAYENDLRMHVMPRWGMRRLDSITVGDVAELIR